MRVGGALGFLLVGCRGFAWRCWDGRCLICWLCSLRLGVCLRLRKDGRWCCCVLIAVSHSVCWVNPKHSYTVTTCLRTLLRRVGCGFVNFPSLVFPAATRISIDQVWSATSWVPPLVSLYRYLERQEYWLDCQLAVFLADGWCNPLPSRDGP